MPAHLLRHPGADVPALAAEANAVPRDDQPYGLVDLLTGGSLARLSVRRRLPAGIQVELQPIA